MRQNDRYHSDTTPSRMVLERYRAQMDEDKCDRTSIALLHYRGGQDEFSLGLEYCQSADALDRAVGADVLAQLGWSDDTFHAESVQQLISLLSDADPLVLSHAASGLGHRADPVAVPHLLPLATHPDVRVRLGAVAGIHRHEDPGSLAAMVCLCTDEAHEVRNQAVFALGALSHANTPEVRAALFAALDDPDHEIRGEGLVGLAIRQDERVVAALLKEWEGEDISILSIEAAEEIKDSRLLPRLNGFFDELDLDEASDFRQKLESAILACSSGHVAVKSALSIEH